MAPLIYKKNNNIYSTNNYIKKPKAQEPWVLTNNLRESGPNVGPKQNRS
jgi:hypothetical protein